MAALTAAQTAELLTYAPDAGLIAAVAAGTADTNPSLPLAVKNTTVRYADGRSDASVKQSARERTGS